MYFGLFFVNAGSQLALITPRHADYQVSDLLQSLTYLYFYTARVLFQRCPLFPIVRSWDAAYVH